MVRGQTVSHRVGQALQPVADEHEHVVHAAVLDLGEDVQPVLGALAAVAGPQPQDLPAALDGDGQGHVDGPVGDLRRRGSSRGWRR